MGYPKQAIILCGGLGTRMRNVTRGMQQKIMLEIDGNPIVEYLIELFKSYDVKDIILSVCYHRDDVKRYFGDGSRFGVRISYTEEDENNPLGTGGALALSREKINGTFVLVNGDNLTDLNIREMYELHETRDALTSIALVDVDDPREYGSVRIDDSDRIVEFLEKTVMKVSPWVNSGFYIMEPGVFDFLLEGRHSLEKDVFPEIVSTGNVYGYKYSGKWIDVGNKERYEKAKQLFGRPEQ
ncbi:MAG: nucleotidyltransferase family protein [Candidatus Aenigmatarchaeota archaeon]